MPVIFCGFLKYSIFHGQFLEWKDRIHGCQVFSAYAFFGFFMPVIFTWPGPQKVSEQKKMTGFSC